MIAARHTPGPWEQKIQSCGFWSICTVYGTEQGWIEIHAPNGSHTADVRAESTANARLIAAAPDLLEALHEVYRQLMNLQPIIGNGLLNDRQLASIDPRIDMCIEAANCAIAKATGGEA